MGKSGEVDQSGAGNPERADTPDSFDHLLRQAASTQPASPLALARKPLALPAVGFVLSEKYELLRLMGEGGMGAVFAARHVVTDKPVAIKWVNPEIGHKPHTVSRFLREARTAARIRHPNVVDVYDVGHEGDAVYLVMELLEGRTLRDVIAERGRLDPQAAVNVLMPVLRGVAAAHAQGVVHRDLKPENIFLCEGAFAQPKVLDFGVSKLADDRDLSLTDTGAVIGTPHYMPPEQARGQRDIDHRADVYALGVILFELLTGARPFFAESYNDLIVKICTEDPFPVTGFAPEVPEALAAIVARALARDPAARFENVAALAEALEPFGQVAFDPRKPVRESKVLPGIRSTEAAILAAVASTGSGTGNPGVAASPPKERSQSESGRKAISGGTQRFDTTLGGAASQMEAPALAAIRPRRWALRGLVVGGITAVGLMVWRFSVVVPAADQSTNASKVVPVAAVASVESPVVVAPPPTPPTASATRYQVDLTVKPVGAAIKIDDRPVGRGAFQGEFSRDGAMHVVSVEADGFVPHTLQFDGTLKETIVLQPVSPARPRSAAPVRVTPEKW